MKKYFLFSGRACRGEYWSVKGACCSISLIFLFIHPDKAFNAYNFGAHMGAASAPLGSLSWVRSLSEIYPHFLEPSGITFSFFSLMLLMFGILYILVDTAVTIRRLHDLDCSGWWILLALMYYAIISILLSTPPESNLTFSLFVLCAWIIFAAWVVASPGTKGENRFG